MIAAMLESAVKFNRCMDIMNTKGEGRMGGREVCVHVFFFFFFLFFFSLFTLFGGNCSRKKDIEGMIKFECRRMIACRGGQC